ncbi:hypothetical protein LUZ60_014996 [Juncus effusus]|nr:hypothetical protein LUZ60_014996 [Juncus effusus]
MGSVVLTAIVLAAVAAFLPAEVVAPASRGPHITDLNILLPPRMSNPVQYRLQGSDGCFRWSWDHHEILSVQPEYNSSSRCSTSARLKSIAPYSGRRETSVYATDLISGTTIRCKVFIDKISRAKIFHHAVKIDLDELAVLQIRAFDEEDNVFNSLVGLQFSWELIPKSGKENDINHLIHVPLKETPLSDCGGFCGDLETQIDIEDKGLGSDLHVVKGIEIGQEIVKAKLFESKFDFDFDQIGDTIILTVAEAMSLDPPSPVLITIDSVINYKLRIIRLNTPHVIELPSPHHKWHVTNNSVATIDKSLGIVHALNLGFSDIFVEDIRVLGHVQSSALHVVIPSEIILYLLPILNASNPLKNVEIIPSSVPWFLFPGQEYAVFVKAFAEGFETHEIYLTEKNKVKLESSTFNYWDMYNYWDVYSVSDEISEIYDWRNSRLLRPISQGKGYLTASMTYQCDLSAPNEVLKLVHEINVCDKVQLFFDEQTEYSKNIQLPWAPGTFQEIKLTPRGGCGKSLSDYKWFSSDERIISISSSGTAYAKKPGQATVKAVSVFDHFNFDQVVIEVSIPASMIFMPVYPTETLVGTELQATVILKSPKGNNYARCEAFNSIIRWRLNSETESFKIIEGPNSKEDLTKNYNSPCALIHLHALTAGKAELTATLSYESSRSYSDTSDGPTMLKAVTQISSFYPLVVYQAGNGNKFGGYSVNLSNIKSDRKALDELYIVPGSSMDLVLFGGPDKWSEKVEFVDNLEILDLSDGILHDSVTVKELPGHVFRVSCQTKGHFKLHFSRGNLAGDDHYVPILATIDMVVVCDIPESIILIANEPENTFDVIEATSKAERNSERVQTNPIVVSNGQNIRLAAVGLHANGKSFANSSSLSLNWKLIGCEGLAFWDKDKNVLSFETSTWERFLTLQNSTGQCIIRASVVGFVESSRKANSLLQNIEKDRLSDAVQLQIVSSLRVIPESALLVYNPEAKISLSISGGTCFLDASTNDTQVVQIIQHPSGKFCTDLVLGPRGLGSADVAVRDIGLSPPALAFSTVKVANVEWIKIISPDQISLMEGTEKDFEILAGTLDGDTFDKSQYVYMDIKVHTDGEILDLITLSNSDKKGANQFSVKAVNLGITSLYVSARQKSGIRVLSEHIKVEVYMKLRLHPEYIYLVPGASYVLSVKGGPKLGAYIEYTSMNQQAVKLNNTSAKLLANSIGNSTIRAAAYTNSGSFICDAYGNVEVGIPLLMGLNLQSEKLCVGCALPVFPSFSKGDLFSFYGVCQAYSWIISNEQVLKFESNEEENSVSLFGKKDSSYMKVLIGRSAGKSEVSVSVSCEFISSGKVNKKIYNASKSVTIVPDPPLALGLHYTWLLPPFYTSSNLLPGRSDITYTMLKSYEKNNFGKKEGIDIDGNKVITGKNGDIGCVQINDPVTGREEIAACIRVSKVEQVRIAAPKLHASHLAVGDEFELDIMYCDDLGYVFSEANGVVPFEVETNYPDILSILDIKDVNSTYTGHKHVVLQARRPGTALVRIIISNDPKKSDYLSVSVGSQIYPKDPILHVGNYVNFTIVGDGAGMNKPRSGQWFSGNESVLSIHKLTGEAHAHGVGTAKVIFKSPNMKLQTVISVMNVDKIIIDSPLEILTNAPFSLDGYKFRVKFSEAKDHKIEGISKLINIPYDCKVEPAFVGYSKPWTDRATETSHCIFIPYTPQHLLSSVLDSKIDQENLADKNGFMQVSVIASVKGDPNVRDIAIFPFVGGFSIEETEKLNFSPSFNKSVITIIGNTDFELSWKATDSISIRPLKIDDFGITGRAEYQVEVLKRQPFTDKILIFLPATGQRAEIEVNYESEKVNSEPTNNTFSSLLSFSLGCILLIISFIIFSKCFDKPDRPAPAQRAGPTSNNSDFAPSTPIHTPIPFKSHTSPQTEPFVDYVRRTVDETPFYKRDSRRRLIDVQKTY